MPIFEAQTLSYQGMVNRQQPVAIFTLSLFLHILRSIFKADNRQDGAAPNLSLGEA